MKIILLRKLELKSVESESENHILARTGALTAWCLRLHGAGVRWGQSTGLLACYTLDQEHKKVHFANNKEHFDYNKGTL